MISNDDFNQYYDIRMWEVTIKLTSWPKFVGSFPLSTLCSIKVTFLHN